MRARIRAVLGALLLTPALATCGGGGTEPSPVVPAGLVLVVAPAESLPDRTTFVPAPTVQLVDADGDPVHQAGVSVTLQTSSVQLVSSCGPAFPRTTDAEGIATFEGCRLRGPAGNYSLKFVSPGLPELLRQVRLTPGLPAFLGTSTVAATRAVGSTVPTLSVWLDDSSYNHIPGRTFQVTIANGGGSVTGTVAGGPTGVASISDWKLDTLVGTNSIWVTPVGAPSISPALFQVNGVPGDPTVIEVDTSWSGPLPIDTTLTAPIRVRGRDRYGNPAAGLAATFVNLDTPDGDGTGVLPGGNMFLDANGEATLPTLKTELRAGRYVLAVGLGPGNSGWYRLLGYTLHPGPPTTLSAAMFPSRSAVGVPIIGAAYVMDKGLNPILSPVDVTILEGEGSAYVDTTLYPGEVWQAVHWTYGVAGSQRLKLTTPVLPGAEAFLTGSAVAPTEIQLIEGGGQTGVVWALLPVQPVFRIVDSAGNGVDSVPLTVSGAGAATGAYQSDIDGYVRLGNAQFQGPPGPVRIRATSLWIPGDTGEVSLTSTTGPLSAIDPISVRALYEVGSPADSVGVLRAHDASGYGLAGVVVHFSASSGGFAVDSATSDSVGRVVIPSWTPGTIAGDATITASAGGVARQLDVYVNPGPVATLSLAGGLAAEGFAGEVVSVAPRIAAKDQYGNAVLSTTGGGASVVAGGGNVVGLHAQADGYLTPENWTLGPVPGHNELQVTFGTVSITVGVEAPAASPFNIVLRGVPETVAAEFGHATYSWRRRITADIPDLTNVNIAGGQCAPFQGGLGGNVDDLVIDVSIDNIDGVGGILGGATPCFIRTVGKLPLLGVMQFDVADLAALRADSTLGDVILHEMGHVLGIGSLWSTDGLIINAGTVNPQYTGPGGKQGWADLGGPALGTVNVPVENVGGPGTADSHWREVVMPSELMTGYLSAAVNPMSVITVRSLTDLGYAVDATTADAYTIGAAPPAQPGRPGVRIRDEVRAPRFTVDANGAIHPIE